MTFLDLCLAYYAAGLSLGLVELFCVLIPCGYVGLVRPFVLLLLFCDTVTNWPLRASRVLTHRHR